MQACHTALIYIPVDTAPQHKIYKANRKTIVYIIIHLFVYHCTSPMVHAHTIITTLLNNYMVSTDTKLTIEKTTTSFKENQFICDM